MNNQEKIQLLEKRLHDLEANGKENNGVQRRIRRDIRNLEKKDGARDRAEMNIQEE